MLILNIFIFVLYTILLIGSIKKALKDKFVLWSIILGIIPIIINSALIIWRL